MTRVKCSAHSIYVKLNDNGRIVHKSSGEICGSTLFTVVEEWSNQTRAHAEEVLLANSLQAPASSSREARSS